MLSPLGPAGPPARRARPGRTDRLGRVGHGEAVRLVAHRVALGAQCRRDRLADGVVVLDEQDARLVPRHDPRGYGRSGGPSP